MNENIKLLMRLDSEITRDKRSIMAIHPHAVELCKDAAARIRELEDHIRYYSNYNEPMTDEQILKSWRENCTNI